MPTFKFAVTETRIVETEYTVEAGSEAEAREKAEIGDTTVEVEIGVTGVSDRHVAELLPPDHA
jgi:hypothetical protein